MTLKSRLTLALALFALLCTAVWAYYPGLAGGFLFDDFANLPALGSFGPIDNLSTLLHYLTSGSADPTGRPLALASFLIDAHNWPADPWPFKRTNLIIHLLNGLLLAWLLTRLGREAGLPDRQKYLGALLGCGFWLLHPLFVSTTLYIVQREAMLPVLFGLPGLLAYVYGRRRLLDGQPWRGGMLACAGLGLATVLATLSKANGALLPLLALILELTVLSQPPVTSRPLYWLRLLALALPCAVLAVALGAMFPHDLSTVPDARPWSIGQRLLTEPQVLLDYLRQLWLPQPYTCGLFHDQFAASTGLLSPWTTLPALLAVLVLPAIAIWQRRKHPFLCAAILFYFAGQLMESSFIPLELYYEHRNYLPALLMFWPLGVWLATPGRHRNQRALLAILILTGLAGFTHMRSSLWGYTTQQALLWERLNPTSGRAAANAAQYLMHAGRPAAAEQRLRRLITAHPEQPQLTINLIAARCMQGSLSARDLKLAEHSLATSRRGTGLLFGWFDKALSMAASGQCRGFDLDGLERLLKAAWRNPTIAGVPGHRQDLYNLQGRIALKRGKVAIALEHFDAALRAEIRPAAGLKQAALLGSAGYPCSGLAQLHLLTRLSDQWEKPQSGMPAVHAWLLQREGYWQHEIARIRRQLEQDARTKHARGCLTNTQTP